MNWHLVSEFDKLPIMIWLGVDEATKITGLTADDIKRWVRHGLLRTRDPGDSRALNYADVIDAREAIDSGRKVSRPVEVLAELRLRLARLERLVEGLCRASDIHVGTTLRHLDDADVYRLYLDAIDALTLDGWNDIRTHDWISTFLQATEIDFDRLASLSGNTHPWKPFLDLCRGMRLWWEAQEGEGIRAAELAFLLDKAEKHLKQQAMFYLMVADRNPERMMERYFEHQPISRLARNYLKLKPR